MWRKLSKLFGWVLQTLPSQNGIFLTFQNCGILDLPHFCVCQYYTYGSEKLYSTVHVCGSSNWSIWEVPWKVDDISDPWHRGNIKWTQVGERMWRKLSQLLGWVLQTLLSETWYSSPSKIVDFWTFHTSAFVNTTAVVLNSYTVLYMCVEVIIFNQIGALKGRWYHRPLV